MAPGDAHPYLALFYLEKIALKMTSPPRESGGLCCLSSLERSFPAFEAVEPSSLELLEEAAMQLRVEVVG